MDKVLKIKNEDIFNRMAADLKNPAFEDGCNCVCCRIERATPTERGRKQFFEKQSFGREPIYYFHHPYHYPAVYDPDDYYLRLMKGKENFDLLTSEYQKAYFGMGENGDWPGFYPLWQDWKGERHILVRLCSWHPNPPSWLGEEDDEKVHLTLGIKHRGD